MKNILFDRHGNRVYNREAWTTEGQWPIGTWMQKRLLTIRIVEASERIGFNGLELIVKGEYK